MQRLTEIIGRRKEGKTKDLELIYESMDSNIKVEKISGTGKSVEDLEEIIIEVMRNKESTVFLIDDTTHMGNIHSNLIDLMSRDWGNSFDVYFTSSLEMLVELKQ